MSENDDKPSGPVFGVTDVIRVMDGEKLRALAEKAQEEQHRREAQGSGEKQAVKPRGGLTQEREALAVDRALLEERRRQQEEIQAALAAQKATETPLEPKASVEAEVVAKKLGAISLGDWVAFAKMVLPTLAVVLPTLMVPINNYLDQREAKFREALLVEVTTVPDGLSEYKAMTERDIKELQDDIKEVESRLGGEIHSSPTSLQNMKKIADIRERLVVVETKLGLEHRRDRDEE